ncbi:MAG: glycosyltransferase family 2 protein [Bacteroidaceae bacterium]|nr:glycosyltransferase family 2 protein [Bacteroidaceae bacterium]
MMDISVIILTYNEEIHIKRCLDRISKYVKNVFIIDSFSTDNTLEIAKEYNNVKILQNKWTNYATQFNWALENADINSEWVLRLDADEYLTPELIDELSHKLPTLGDDVSGVIFPLRRVFLGRVIRRGMNQVKLLRLFRNGKAKSEVRLMDEHIQLLDGHAIEFDNEFADDNLNNLSWWAQKHIGYAIREAVDLLDIELDLTNAGKSDENKQISEQAHKKRMMKHKYARKPLFWRSFAYFCYRYFFKLGFLEGKEGFLWHFMQGWWYRTMVDAKVFEIKKACGNDKELIKKHLRKLYNINI